jgi:hypothetical protein
MLPQYPGFVKEFFHYKNQLGLKSHRCACRTGIAPVTYLFLFYVLAQTKK